MGIELFLTKIAAAVFKNTALGPILTLLKVVVKVQSAFDETRCAARCVSSRNDCSDLGLFGLSIVSDRLTDYLVEQFVAIGRTTFRIEMSNNGIYIASNVVPRFCASDMDPQLEQHFALAQLPQATEPEEPSLIVATFHDVRAEQFLRKQRYDDAICHLLQGLQHKWVRFRRAGDIRKAQELYADAIRYYVASVRERGPNLEDYQSIAQCYEQLGRYEEALELYFMHWTSIGHYEEVYKHYKCYKDKASSFQLPKHRFTELVTSMRYICENWMHGTYHVTTPEITEIERDIVRMEKELAP